MSSFSKEKWTILMVSYKSNVYIKWQLKILYEFNNPADFRVVIVENNSESDKREIELIAKDYKEKYNNIDIYYYEPKSLKRPTPRIDEFGMIVARDEHGDTIDFAKSKVTTKYTLIQDPDFFFLQKNHLNILEEQLKDNVAVGAPYLKTVGLGAKNFPTAFGCAYRTEEIKDLDFIGGHGDERILNLAANLYPKKSGYGFSLDVGFRARYKLSKKSYVTFDQIRDSDPYLRSLSKVMGGHGFTLPCYYYLNGKNIAVHLFGGSRAPDDLVGYKYLNSQQKEILYKSFLKTRANIAEYFYSIVKFRSRKGCLNPLYKIYLSLSKIFRKISVKRQHEKLTQDMLALSTGKKWTVGMVNYKTFSYLPFQLKSLFEFNDPKEFEVIIVDNSFPHQTEELEGLKKQYAEYDNIKIIYHRPTVNRELKGSIDHAEGLNLILQETKTPYLLVHDPDFFWIKKNYLKIMESYLLQGKVTIGAPYTKPVKIGKPNFPAAFGCAFLVDALRNNNLNFDVGNTLEEVTLDHKDVGWKIRERLSVEPAVSFTQTPADIRNIFGQHTFQTMSMQYFLDGEKFAYHLYRGSFVDTSENYRDAPIEQSAPQNWEDARKKYAEFFYFLTSGMKKEEILKMLNISK